MENLAKFFVRSATFPIPLNGGWESDALGWLLQVHSQDEKGRQLKSDRQIAFVQCFYAKWWAVPTHPTPEALRRVMLKIEQTSHCSLLRAETLATKANRQNTHTHLRSETKQHDEADQQPVRAGAEVARVQAARDRGTRAALRLEVAASKHVLRVDRKRGHVRTELGYFTALHEHANHIQLYCSLNAVGLITNENGDRNGWTKINRTQEA